MFETFKCSRCKQEKPVQTDGGTGYAIDARKRKICYECCAEVDKLDMERTGRATLYLSEDRDKWTGEVINWCGTLRFPVLSRKGGSHNIGGSRIDLWFDDHTGARWHGVQIGCSNSIVRARRLKRPPKMRPPQRFEDLTACERTWIGYSEEGDDPTQWKVYTSHARYRAAYNAAIDAGLMPTIATEAAGEAMAYRHRDIADVVREYVEGE